MNSSNKEKKEMEQRPDSFDRHEKMTLFHRANIFEKTLENIEEAKKMIEASAEHNVEEKQKALLELDMARFTAYIFKEPPDLKKAEQSFQWLENTYHFSSHIDYMDSLISVMVSSHRDTRNPSEQFSGQWLIRPRLFLNFFLKQPKIHEHYIYLCLMFLIEESIESQQEAVAKAALSDAHQHLHVRNRKKNLIIRLINRYLLDFFKIYEGQYKKYLKQAKFFIKLLENSKIVSNEYLKEAYLRFGITRLIAKDDLSLVIELFKKAVHKTEHYNNLSIYQEIIDGILGAGNFTQQLDVILKSLRPEDDSEAIQYDYYIMTYFNNKKEQISSPSMGESKMLASNEDQAASEHVKIQTVSLPPQSNLDVFPPEPTVLLSKLKAKGSEYISEPSREILRLEHLLVQSTKNKDYLKAREASNELITKIETYPYYFMDKNNKLLNAYIMRCVVRFKLSSHEDCSEITKKDFARMVQLTDDKQSIFSALIIFTLTRDCEDIYKNNSLKMYTSLIPSSNNLLRFLESQQVEQDNMTLLYMRLIEIYHFSGASQYAKAFLSKIMESSTPCPEQQKKIINHIIHLVMRKDRHKRQYLFYFAPLALELISEVAPTFEFISEADQLFQERMTKHYIELCVELIHLHRSDHESEIISNCFTAALQLAGIKAKEVYQEILSKCLDCYGDQAEDVSHVRFLKMLELIKTNNENAKTAINNTIEYLSGKINAKLSDAHAFLKKLTASPMKQSQKQSMLPSAPSISDAASERKAALIKTLQEKKDTINTQLNELKIDSPLLNQSTLDTLNAFLKEKELKITSFAQKIKEDNHLQSLLQKLRSHSLDEHQRWTGDFQSLFAALDKEIPLLQENFLKEKALIKAHIEKTEVILQECKALSELTPDELKLSDDITRSMKAYQALSTSLSDFKKNPIKSILDKKSQELDELSKKFESFPKKISQAIVNIESRLEKIPKSKNTKPYRDRLIFQKRLLNEYEKELKPYLDAEHSVIAETRDIITHLSTAAIQVSSARNKKNKRNNANRLDKQKEMRSDLNNLLSTTDNEIAEFKKREEILRERMKIDTLLHECEHKESSAEKIIRKMESQMKDLRAELLECRKKFIERYDVDSIKVSQIQGKSARTSEAIMGQKKEILDKIDNLEEKITSHLPTDRSQNTFDNLLRGVHDKIAKNSAEYDKTHHRLLCQKHLRTLTFQCEKIKSEIKTFSESKANGFEKHQAMLAFLNRLHKTAWPDTGKKLYNANTAFNVMKANSDRLQKEFKIENQEKQIAEELEQKINAAKKIRDETRESINSLTEQYANIYKSTIYELASDRNMSLHLGYLLKIIESLDKASAKRKSQGKMPPHKVIRVRGSLAKALHLLELGLPNAASRFPVNDIDCTVSAPHFGELAETLTDTCKTLSLKTEETQRNAYYISIKITIPNSNLPIEMTFANSSFYKTKPISHLMSDEAFFTGKSDSPLEIDKSHQNYPLWKKASLGKESYIKYAAGHQNYLWRLFKEHGQFKVLKRLLKKEGIEPSLAETKSNSKEVGFFEALHDVMHQFKDLIQKKQPEPHRHFVSLLKNVYQSKNKIKKAFTIQGKEAKRLLDDIDNDLKSFLKPYLTLLLNNILKQEKYLKIGKQMSVDNIVKDIIPHMEIIFEIIEPLLEKPLNHDAPKTFNSRQQLTEIFPYLIEKILNLKIKNSSNDLTPQIIQSFKEEFCDHVSAKKIEEPIFESKEEEHSNKDDSAELSELIISAFLGSTNSSTFSLIPAEESGAIKPLSLNSMLQPKMTPAPFTKDQLIAPKTTPVVMNHPLPSSQNNASIAVSPVAISHPLPSSQDPASIIAPSALGPLHHANASQFFNPRKPAREYDASRMRHPIPSQNPTQAFAPAMSHPMLPQHPAQAFAPPPSSFPVGQPQFFYQDHPAAQHAPAMSHPMLPHHSAQPFALPPSSFPVGQPQFFYQDRSAAQHAPAMSHPMLPHHSAQPFAPPTPASFPIGQLQFLYQDQSAARHAPVMNHPMLPQNPELVFSPTVPASFHSRAPISSFPTPAFISNQPVFARLPNHSILGSPLLSASGETLTLKPQAMVQPRPPSRGVLPRFSVVGSNSFQAGREVPIPLTRYSNKKTR